MSIEWFLALLPWLAILACPVVMFWMMRRMHGGSCGKEQAAGGSDARGPVAADVHTSDALAADTHPADVNAELTLLKERLASLEAQRAVMDVETYR